MARKLIVSALLLGAALAGCGKTDSTPGAAPTPGASTAVTPAASPASDPSLPDAASAVGSSAASAASAP